MAKAYENKSDYPAAQEAANTGLEILTGIESESVEAGRIYLWMGITNYRQAQPTAALALCEQGIAIFETVKAEQLDGLKDLAQAYLLRGLLYGSTGRNQVARSNLERSIALYEETSDMAGQDRAYTELGFVEQNLGKWDRALYFFQKVNSAVKASGRLGVRPQQPLTWEKFIDGAGRCASHYL